MMEKTKSCFAADLLTRELPDIAVSSGATERMMNVTSGRPAAVTLGMMAGIAFGAYGTNRNNGASLTRHRSLGDRARFKARDKRSR